MQRCEGSWLAGCRIESDQASGHYRVVSRGVLATAVVLGVVLAACSATHSVEIMGSRQHVGSQGTGRASTTAVAPSSATVEIPDGVDNLRLTTAPGISTMTARVTSGASVALTRKPGNNYVVLFGTPRRPGATLATLILNEDTVWRVELDGGVSTLDVAMSNSRLKQLDLQAGVSSATIALPPPRATLSVVEAAGVSTMTVATQALVRVDASAGAATIDLHGVRHEGVAGGTSYSDTGWRHARNRVRLQLLGGVSALNVRR